MSGAQFPEGWVLLAILFIFPFLIARKNVFDTDKILHAYMQDTEKHLIRIIDKFSLWLCHAKAFYISHRSLNYLSERLQYNVFYRFPYILGSILYTAHRKITQKH